MKRFSISLALALATVSLLAAGTPAHSGERPIHAEGRGLISLTGFSADLYGWGKGEHLGGSTLVMGLDLFELYDEGIVAPRYLQIEAANGDILTFLVVSDFDPETGIVTGTIKFFNGSGRFADATGSARLRIVPDTSWYDYFDGFPFPRDQTRFSWSLEGTIDY